MQSRIVMSLNNEILIIRKNVGNRGASIIFRDDVARSL